MVRGEIIAVVVFNFTGSQLKLWVVKLTCLYGFGKGFPKIKNRPKTAEKLEAKYKTGKKEIGAFHFPEIYHTCTHMKPK